METKQKLNEIKNNIEQIIKKIKKGDSFFLRNLKVTPLYLEIKLDKQNEKFYTLDEALENKSSVRITDTGNINNVNIENRGDANLFVMDGEQLVGGLQNRMFVSSFNVQPHTSRICEVRCIEAGRWQGYSKIFKSQNDLSYTKLRLLNLYYTRINKPHKSQEAIWKDIDNISKKLNYYSKTSSLTDINRFMDNIFENYIENYNYSGENGYIIEFDNKIISFEILSDNSIVARIYKKMLKSYLYDSITLEGEEKNLQNFRKLEDEIENLKFSQKESTKTEKEIRLYSNRVEGKFYNFNNRLFQLELLNNRKTGK